jgi:Bcr/CflA subfamily drug resistance transporter
MNMISSHINQSISNIINQKKKIIYAIFAILIVPLSGLAIDIYAPSLPSVAVYFNADKSLVQLTITSYMMGIGIMQLFAGGISDSFGRRNPFLIASSIFLISTLIIPHAQTISQLLVLRFIQGSAAAGTIVPMRSIIPDLFEGRELYKWMNYMTMAWSIGPVIAPAIGGYLQHYFGWKSNFYFLALYIFMTGLMIYFYLPETSKHRHSFHIINILKRYKEIMSNLSYLSYLIMNGLLYSLIILFTVGGPFLIQTEMHYSAIQFGNIALMLGGAWFLGTMTNKFLIDIPFAIKAKFCLFSMLMLAILMLITALSMKMNIYILIVPLFFISWLGGIVFPNNFAKAITLFPTMTGSANALFGGFIYVITSLSSSIATYLKSTTLVPFAIAYIGLISFCLLITYFQKIKQL